MTDIVEKLKQIKPYNYNMTDDEAQVIAEEAIETIQNLRAALHKIGYDYVELSHEKVQILYIEHIGIARKAYQESFPKQETKEKTELNDDF